MAWTADLGDVTVLRRVVPEFYEQQRGRLADLGIEVAATSRTCGTAVRSPRSCWQSPYLSAGTPLSLWS